MVLAGDISWAMRLEDCPGGFRLSPPSAGKKADFKGHAALDWKIEKFWSDCGFDNLALVHNSACPVEEFAVCGTRGWLYNSETPEDQKIVSREAGRLRASLDEAEKLGLRPVVFLHYPPVYDNMECRGILEVLEERGITECYFGHIHGTQAARKAVCGGISRHPGCTWFPVII